MMLVMPVAVLPMARCAKGCYERVRVQIGAIPAGPLCSASGAMVGHPGICNACVPQRWSANLDARGLQLGLAQWFENLLATVGAQTALGIVQGPECPPAGVGSMQSPEQDGGYRDTGCMCQSVHARQKKEPGRNAIAATNGIFERCPYSDPATHMKIQHRHKKARPSSTRLSVFPVL
ncbi:MAG: hypothetical protein KBG95_05290, partial [Brachymonas sp.]|nr:hypothetical protein [Brachymonas sp.]